MANDQNRIIIILASAQCWRTLDEELSTIFLHCIAFERRMTHMPYISKQRDFRNSHPEKRNGKSWTADEGLRLVNTEHGSKYFNVQLRFAWIGDNAHLMRL